MIFFCFVCLWLSLFFIVSYDTSSVSVYVHYTRTIHSCNFIQIWIEAEMDILFEKDIYVNQSPCTISNVYDVFEWVYLACCPFSILNYSSYDCLIETKRFVAVAWVLIRENTIYMCRIRIAVDNWRSQQCKPKTHHKSQVNTEHRTYIRWTSVS